MKIKTLKMLRQALNNVNIQYHYAPEMPVDSIVFAVFGEEKHGSDSWS